MAAGVSGELKDEWMRSRSDLRRRERALAGDTRAGRWARGKARRTQRAFVREHWLALALLSTALLAMFGICAVFADNGFQRGLVVGGGLAATAGILVNFVLQMSGTAPTMMGDVAEQWTAQSLRALLPHGWKLVNHIMLTDRAGDMDHVLVGPGGIFVLKIKWSASPWSLDRPDSFMLSALKQVENNARLLGLWQEVRARTRQPVTPVLVLWGAASKALESIDSGVVGYPERSVKIIAGSSLKSLTLSREGAGLDAAAVSAVWVALERQAQHLDDREDPLPRSVADHVLGVSFSVAIACVAFVLSTWALTATGSISAWLVLTAVLGLFGVALRRRLDWPPLGTAVTTGAILAPLLGAIVILASQM